MGTIYFFPSSAVIYNDKVIPIILELARQGNRVHTIFLDFQAYHHLGKGGSYGHWLRELTDCRALITKQRWNFFDKVWFVLRYARLVLEMRWLKGYLAFFDGKGASSFGKRLSRTAKQRGTSFIFSAWYMDPWQGYDWEKILENDAFCRKLKGKSSSEFQENKKKVVEIYDCVRGFLFHQDVCGHEEHLKHIPSCVVPHPKLQPWWGAFLDEYPPVFGHPVLDRAKEYIAVFLTHQGNYLFREDSDLDVLVHEIISSVRQIFPDMPIVMKPKQTALFQKKWFEEFRKSIDDLNVLFVDAPVSVLAQRARAGIMTGHYTAQFEFMIGDAPWIEYCRYSDFWKEVYPQRTYTTAFGGSLAETPEELECLLRKVEKGVLKTDQRAFRKQMDFYEQNISFDFFAAKKNI